MPLFYAHPIIENSPIHLSEEESRHCIKTLRFRQGDVIEVTDGIGHLYECRITEDNPKSCLANIISSKSTTQSDKIHLHIAISPTKNMNRMEWFVEKATELGVAEITPLITRQSERRIVKPERLNRLIISAGKQSLNTRFPILHPTTKINDFLSQPLQGKGAIAYCGDIESIPITTFCNSSFPKVTILIGPEGDFTASEVKSVINRGYQPISLGENRLRTETAGIVAATIALFQKNLIG